MPEAKTISGILKSTMHGPAWHGDGILQVLEGVTAAQAYAKPIPAAHSIWEIVLHTIAWQGYASDVLKGGDGDTLRGEVDWPPAPENPDEGDWVKALEKLESGAGEIRELIAGLDDDALREPAGKRDFNLKFLLHGVIHHNLYHGGQIGLLKRALAGG